MIYYPSATNTFDVVMSIIVLMLTLICFGVLIKLLIDYLRGK